MYNFSSKELLIFSELELINNQLRVLQIKNNNTETRCLASGSCCQIGLVIPMAECARIAYQIILNYYQEMESFGEKSAEEFLDNIIFNLIDAFDNPKWGHGDNFTVGKWCAFYDNGCTIYNFRPMVCRAFGTISDVDDYCPRKRLKNGGIVYFRGSGIKKIVNNYLETVKKWADLHPDQNHVIFMPLGILKFLLDDKAMRELAERTDQKFWLSQEIYKLQLFEDLR